MRGSEEHALAVELDVRDQYPARFRSAGEPHRSGVQDLAACEHHVAEPEAQPADVRLEREAHPQPPLDRAGLVRERRDRRTSCSAITSASSAASTSAILWTERTPSIPTAEWMFQVTMRIR